MQTDVKRGLILGILVLAVLIVIWSQFQDSKSPATMNVGAPTDPAASGQPVSEPVLPTRMTATDTTASSTPATQPPTQQDAAASRPVDAEVVQAVPATQAPAARTHVGKKDETLWVIAKQYYSNGSKWTLIYDANKSQLSSPEALVEGTRLVIPPDPAAAPAPATAKKASPAPQAASAKTAKDEKPKDGVKDAIKDAVKDLAKSLTPKDTMKEQPKAAAARQHVVAAGDSLSGIARKYYGDSKHWRVVLKANQDKIADADVLPVGAVLVIPPLAGSAS